MKTAEELNIQQWEFNNLIQVRDDLATGKLKHINLNEEFEFQIKHLKKRGFTKLFNMGTACECGTIACIGGWVALYNGMSTDETRYYVEFKRSETLYELFYPGVDSSFWSSIKPHHAVKAINNFLKTGDPKWEEVLNRLKF